MSVDDDTDHNVSICKQRIVSNQDARVKLLLLVEQRWYDIDGLCLRVMRKSCVKS